MICMMSLCPSGCKDGTHMATLTLEIEGLGGKYAKWLSECYFLTCSKIAEFWHVNFISDHKHCSVFLFLQKKKQVSTINMGIDQQREQKLCFLQASFLKHEEETSKKKYRAMFLHWNEVHMPKFGTFWAS